jgi:CspA family cold shock protein
LKGKVKNWLDYRGFGFIEIEGQDDDIFVHHSEISTGSSLKAGQSVEFEVEDTSKGPQATNVRIIV